MRDIVRKASLLSVSCSPVQVQLSINKP